MKKTYKQQNFQKQKAPSSSTGYDPSYDYFQSRPKYTYPKRLPSATTNTRKQPEQQQFNYYNYYQHQHQPLPRINTAHKQQQPTSFNEEQFNEDFSLIQNMWDDLGVQPSFRAVFESHARSLDDESRKDLFQYENTTLKRLRDCLLKLSKQITNRENAVLTLRKYNDVLSKTFPDPNENLDESFITNIINTIKSIRVYSVNVVNYITKIREIISYGESHGKFNVDNINKAYQYDKHYLIRMKYDVDFMRFSPICNYIETKNVQCDTFLLNMSINENSADPKKRTVPVDEELLKLIKQCQNVIKMDEFYIQVDERESTMLMKGGDGKVRNVSGGSNSNTAMIGVCGNNMSQTLHKLKETKGYTKLFLNKNSERDVMGNKVGVVRINKSKAEENRYKAGNEGKIRIEREEIQSMTKEELMRKIDEMENEIGEEEKGRDNKEEEVKKAKKKGKKKKKKEKGNKKENEEKVHKEEEKEDINNEKEKSGERKGSNDNKEDNEQQQKKEQEEHKSSSKSRSSSSSSSSSSKSSKKSKSKSSNKKEESVKKEIEESFHKEESIKSSIKSEKVSKKSSRKSSKSSKKEEVEESFHKEESIKSSIKSEKPSKKSSRKSSSKSISKKEESINKEEIEREESIKSEKHSKQSSKSHKENENENENNKSSSKHSHTTSNKNDNENENEDEFYVEPLENESNKKINLDDKIPQTEYIVSAYTSDFHSFYNLYSSNYFPNIPSTQKKTFDLQNTISPFLKGTNPKILYSYPSTTESSPSFTDTNFIPSGICAFSFTQAFPNRLRLQLNHLSTSSTTNFVDQFTSFIRYIKARYTFDEMFIILHYENTSDGFVLDKDISSFFRNTLNFRWANVENLSEGKRSKSMIWQREWDANANSNYASQIIPSPSFQLNELTLLRVSKKENYVDDNDNIIFDKYINAFTSKALLYMLNNEGNVVISDNDTLSEDAMKWDRSKIEKNALSKLKITLNISNVNDIEQHYNYNMEDFINECNNVNYNDEHKINSLSLQLCPQVKNLLSITYNNYYYNRIEDIVYTFIEPKSQSKVYKINFNDNLNSMFIIPLTSKVKNMLLETNDNFHMKLNNFLMNAKQTQDNEEERTTAMYIPCFKIEGHFNAENVPGLYDVKLKNQDEEDVYVQGVDDYFKVEFNYDNNYNQNFSLVPKTNVNDVNEVIIDDSFIIAISNQKIVTDIGVPIIQVFIVDKSMWKCTGGDAYYNGSNSNIN